MSIPKHQPRMKTIDSFLMKVNKALQPCTQNIVKAMKSSSFVRHDDTSAPEHGEGEGTKAIHLASQDGGSEAVTPPDKENTGSPPHLDEPQGSVTQSAVSSLPEPKLSSFPVSDFSMPVVMETKEPTELERLKQRFMAQLEQTKKPPQAGTVVATLAGAETQSLISPDLIVQLKDKPGGWSRGRGEMDSSIIMSRCGCVNIKNEPLRCLATAPARHSKEAAVTEESGGEEAGRGGKKAVWGRGSRECGGRGGRTD